jgi:HAD superfamily hydrolase (TIGR01509 family)
MSRPALVLFDLDGVLVHYDHGPRLRMLAERSGASFEAVATELFDSGLERAADLGDYDAEGQMQELSRRLGRPVSVQDGIAARAASMVADVATLALAHDVHAEVAILTNNGLLLRDFLPEICPPLFPRFADRVLCSAQFRLAKPDPEIYRCCVAALGFTPAQTLFIDDKAQNAEGACRAGLMAHHFRHADGLRAELLALNLLEPDA